jgi:Mrp family chromosome partitioning ATPase/capsular polysaccharide biosynthesis protein
MPPNDPDDAFASSHDPVPPAEQRGKFLVTESLFERGPRLAASRVRAPRSAAADSADWIAPVDTERRLGYYLDAIWAGRWIVIMVVVAALAGGIAYVSTAPKVYEAHSQLLVTPIPASSNTSGLGLVQQSSDPLRDVQTAAGFVSTIRVANGARQTLRTSDSAQSLLDAITVSPIANSDVVDIAAKGDSPEQAKHRADAVAMATVADRTASLYDQLNVLIPRLQAQLAALPASLATGRASLEGRLAQLTALKQGPDPTIRIQALADLPTSPISPRKALTLAAALFAGIVAGVGIVFLLQLFDPRLRHEEELRARFRLPILARVPKASGTSRKRLPGRGRAGPIVPRTLTAEANEAYRALRSVLASTRARQGGPRVVLVTSAMSLDGKTSTAISLANALAFEERVTLIEGDLRRPSIASALHIMPRMGVENVLFGHFSLEDALVDTSLEPNGNAPHLRMLLAKPETGSPILSPSAFGAMLAAARDISDWVVIDSPPLIYAPDLLSAVPIVDDVILVVRLGNTNVRNLDQTAEMLAQHGIRPAGFVIVGTSGHPGYY